MVPTVLPVPQLRHQSLLRLPIQLEVVLLLPHLSLVAARPRMAVAVVQRQRQPRLAPVDLVAVVVVAAVARCWLSPLACQDLRVVAVARA